MAKQGPAWAGGRADVIEEPGLAELLDPIALEERLREARARRSEALAKRANADPEIREPVGLPMPVPRATASRSVVSRQRTVWFAMIFLAGLAAGGAIVAFVSQPTLRNRVAQLIAPEVMLQASAPDAGSTAPAAPAGVPAVALPVIPTGGEGPATRDAARTSPRQPPLDATPALPSASDASARAQIATVAPEPADVSPNLPAVGSEEPAAAPAQPATLSAPVIDGQPAGPPSQALVPSLLPPRVVIHYPASTEAAATAVRDDLLAAGVPDVTLVSVGFPIGRSNVRFYHEADREGAERIVALVAPEMAGTVPEPRDFTDFTPPPLPGRVELWLSGETRASAAPLPEPTSRPAVAETPPPPPPPAAAEAAPQNQAEAVARILVQRALDRLLQEGPAR